MRLRGERWRKSRVWLWNIGEREEVREREGISILGQNKGETRILDSKNNPRVEIITGVKIWHVLTNSLGRI